MRILVTGGAGFIGSNFIQYMVSKYPKYHILCYDKLTYAGNLDRLDSTDGLISYFVEGDICNEEFLDWVIDEAKIDTIVNFAAETHVDNSIESSDEFIKTNINGTHTLLKMLHKYEIKKFVQISTDEVYGALSENDKPFTENTPLAPNSPYSASKTSADLLCRSFYETYKYPIVITRCSNNYGSNQHTEKLIPKMIENIKSGKKIPIYGDGRNIRDWVHVEDHCEAIDLVLHKGKNGEVYNIGGECEKRNIDIANIVLSHLNASTDLIEYVEDRKGHDWRYAVDITKIKNELGWYPKRKFNESVKELV